MEVNVAHTYFAGELDVWAHNSRGRALEKVIGSCSINTALDLLEEFLGPNYSDEGNGRYRSEDGNRQARLGDHETRNPRNQHCHMEEVRNGRVIFNGVIKLIGR